jgi:hypothetical protein
MGIIPANRIKNIVKTSVIINLINVPNGLKYVLNTFKILCIKLTGDIPKITSNNTMGYKYLSSGTFLDSINEKNKFKK